MLVVFFRLVDILLQEHLKNITTTTKTTPPQQNPINNKQRNLRPEIILRYLRISEHIIKTIIKRYNTIRNRAILDTDIVEVV